MIFYYFFGHPNNLTVFAAVAKIIKNGFSGSKNIAIIYEHTFLENCDYQLFLNNFDSVHRLPYADFQRNIIKGFIGTARVRKILKSIKIEENSIFFSFQSMEWITNIFIKYVKRSSPGTKIIFLTTTDTPYILLIRNYMLSFLNFLYALIFDGYFMYSLVNSDGFLGDREYLKEPSDFKFLIGNLENKSLPGKNKTFPNAYLPYPVFEFANATQSFQGKKAVIFFGDATYFEYYTELDQKFFFERLNLALKEIKRKYTNEGTILFYKPHPFDQGKVMDNIDISGFKIFDERLTAEMMFSFYKEGIISVYTVSSSSCYYASMFGIPAYVLYKYCWSDEELKKKINKYFCNSKDNLIFKEVESLHDIGSVDNLRFDVDEVDIRKKWVSAIGSVVDGCSTGELLS